jgi:hypothetical protein
VGLILQPLGPVCGVIDFRGRGEVAWGSPRAEFLLRVFPKTINALLPSIRQSFASGLTAHYVQSRSGT